MKLKMKVVELIADLIVKQIGEMFMATVQDIKDAIVAEASQVKGRVDELEATVKDLKDRMQNGIPVTQADLDEIHAAVQNIFVPVVAEAPAPEAPAPEAPAPEAPAEPTA